MNFGESLQSAIYNVKANKTRSFLTMLGIIIGISSVITIVSIGQGGKQFMTGEFEGLGTNVINLTMKSGDDVEKRDYYTLEDIALLKKKIPEVTHIAAWRDGFGSTKTENKSKRTQIAAINEDYYKLAKPKMIKGRFIIDRDIEAQSAVAVIDSITAKTLFGNEDPIDKKVKVVNQDLTTTLRVIGVYQDPSEKFAGMFGDNMPGSILLPMSISERIIESNNGDIRQLAVYITDMTKSKEVTSKMVKMIENRHRNSGKYVAAEGFKELDSINKVLSTFTAVIGAIAGISLLVGGIGVMNIMLVSVTERTREIGIRMAIGAKRRDIKIQFLTESLIICLIGGTIGMLLGVGMGLLVGKLINISALPSVGVILLSFLFSSAVGIFFGYYPANQAAKLDPIEALRYE